MNTTTDQELLQGRAAGTARMQELMERHGAMVYATARRRAPADAEDVTQAVFVLLWQKAVRLGGMPSLAGWLYRATVYACRNANKMRGRREQYEREAAMQKREAAAAGEPEILGLLDEGLAKLGRTEREAVLLRYLEGASAEETAGRLGTTAKAASKRAERGLEKLRGFMTAQACGVALGGLVGVMAGEAGAAVPVTVAAGVAQVMAGGTASAQVGSLATMTGRMMTMVKAQVAVAWLLAIGAGAVLLGLLATGKGVPKPAVVPAAGPTITAATQRAPTTVETQPAWPKSVRITARGTEGKSPRTWVLSYVHPDKLRIEDAQTGVVESIVNGNAKLSTEPRTKLYVVEPADKADMGYFQTTALWMVLPGAKEGESRDIGTMAWMGEPTTRLRVEWRRREKVGQEELDVCEMVRVMPEGSKPAMGSTRMECSYDGRGVCRRIVSTGEGSGSGEMWIEYIELNESLFELKGPAGYTDVREGVFPRLSPELREIATKYYAAREQIQRFRMVAFQERDRLPRYRMVRDGEKWRVDSGDIGGMVKRKEFNVANPGQADTRTVLDRACRMDYPVEHVVMTREGQMAQVGFNYSTEDGGPRARAQWLIPPLLVTMRDAEWNAGRLAERRGIQWYRQPPRGLVGRSADFDLRQLGWPAWEGDVLVAPHGWDMGSALPEYYRLAERADRAGLVGVRAIQGPMLKDYWIDPAHDHLCVEYGEHFDQAEPWKADPAGWSAAGDLGMRRITKFAKTRSGKWYPAAVGKTLVMLDEEAVDPTLFDWPANAPALPGKTP